MPGRMSFDFNLTERRPRSRAGDESAMRILVMGDFSGRASRHAEDYTDIAQRKPALIDVDELDRVMARMGPRLQLSIPGGGEVSLEFQTVEDFHPDALYRRVPIFQRLREVRQRMQDAATFVEAAAEFRGAAHPAEQSGSLTAETDTDRQRKEDNADTFARLLGATSTTSPQSPLRSRQGPVDVDALIRNMVAPYIVPDAPPHQAQYVAAVDAAIGDQMRALLHHPDFQALEALWRGAQWLTANIETNEQLELYVLDITRAELLADIRAAQANVDSSGLYRLLVEQAKGTAGGEPWSLMVGDFAFGLSGEDIGSLAFLGAVASQGGGPLVAAAKPQLVGTHSIASNADPREWQPLTGEEAENWSALRESMMAPWIGLTLPRFVLRLPYGKTTDRVEQFDFDELASRREHEDYLWANGAFACAVLIARAFSSRGWDMEPGDELEVGDLPAHTYEDDGEKRLQPCAEVNLTDRAGQAIVDAGLIPLLSHKTRNAVRVMRFQSIAKPAQPLEGPWNRSRRNHGT